MSGFGSANASEGTVCVYCGASTKLFDRGVPVCPQCDTLPLKQRAGRKAENQMKADQARKDAR